MLVAVFATRSFGVEALPADTLIHHCEIVPAHDGQPDAVAIYGSRIVAIGKSADLIAACPASCAKIDAAGKFLTPGFQDSHVHLMSAGRAFFEVKLDKMDLPSIQSAVRDYAKAHAEKEWIVGGMWRIAAFSAAHPPHRRDLDAAEAQRPVALHDSSGHQLWVNSAALNLAGITRETADPAGGRIVRDAQGEPTGVLLENATAAIYAAIPMMTIEEIRQYIRKGQEIGLRHGVTSAQGNTIPLSVRHAQVYADLERDGLLIQRSFLWGNLVASPAEFEATVKFAHAMPPEGHVQVVAFKGFVDGVLSGQTAAMFEPYSNRPGDRGLPRMSQERLNEFVLRANRAGFPVALHAIGDRGVHMALDAFENSQAVLGKSLRNRVEHASVIAPADIPRFAKLGVVASVQPAFMFYGSRKDFAVPEAALGPERIKGLFLWKSLTSTGATLIGSSDYPSSGKIGPDPIAGLHCLIHRTFGDGTPFTPEERLDPDAALAVYTSAPAEVIGLGKTLGRIEVGYEADLVLLDQDPRLAIATNASQNPPVKIWIGGKQVK
jgi:hypothetical protein